MHRFRSATMSVSLLALALAGCNKSAPDMSAVSASPSASASPDSGLPPLPAALPMQTGPAAPLTTAPPVAALPTRRYVNVARPANDRQAYAYLDRASDIEDAIGDAPPDYGYRNNDGVSPWVWQTNGGDYRYAEPADDGYRYYYYQPGARYPYLVRTHDYSYAYAGAALVAVYALSGALLPPDRYDGYRDQASRYFWRGQQLRDTSDQQQHEGVNAANWAARRAEFSAAQASWAADRAQQAEWQAYHAQNDPSQRPGWQQEHQQRQQMAQQFSGWQARGLEGPPPPALAARGPARPYGGQPQPYRAVPNAVPAGGAGQDQFHNEAGRDMSRPQSGFAPGGQNPNTAGLATAARDRQLAAQQERRAQAEANQRLVQQARAAQQATDARQQLAGQARQRQDIAARQAQQRELQQREVQQREVMQRQAQQHEAQQRDAQASAREVQMRDLAAQRQAETARAPEMRGQREAVAHEHAQQVAAAHERAPAAHRPPEERPPAPHVEAQHPEHHEPGHGEPERKDSHPR